MRKVPKLRFKEFTDEWEEKKLGEISEIYDGIHQTPNYVEKGIKFVIATGRHYEDAKYFFNQIGVAKYLISGNGSFIHDED